MFYLLKIFGEGYSDVMSSLQSGGKLKSLLNVSWAEQGLLGLVFDVSNTKCTT